MGDDVLERLAIRELVENWAVWRDAGDWERFRTVWHDDGRMMATWFQGTGGRVHRREPRRLRQGCQHPALPGRQLRRPRGQPRHRPDQDDDLAARPRARRAGRRRLHGRFYDFLEKRDGRWGLVLRQPIYEKDRMDPVDPAARLTLDPACSKRFPEGYRHLAYLQTQIGFTVKPDMPGLKGPEVEALYARGRLARGWPL